MKLKIDYETSYEKYNFRNNVKEAVKSYLNDKKLVYQKNEGEDYVNIPGIILYPKALNPFLKIMESLGESKNIIIVPAFDNNEKPFNSPAYLIIKYPSELYAIDSIIIE